MEIIGRLVMMVVLMATASVIGFFCSLTVFALLRKRDWKKPTVVAGLLPPGVVGYLLVCLIGSGILSALIGTPDLLFGDINERLPNGYDLQALDKMPEAGRIQKLGDSLAAIAWVSELEVRGPFVLGKYDYTYFPRTPEEVGRNFFLFDTRNGAKQNFATQEELAGAINAPVHLKSTASFRGGRTFVQSVAIVMMLLVAFLPPICITVWLLWQLSKLLKGNPANGGVTL